MKANIGPLEFSFSRLSKSELKSLMDSSSRSLDEESDASSDDEHWTTGSQVTHKARNSLTRQLLHPFTECGNLNEALPLTPLIALSPKSNRTPDLFMETELQAEDAHVIPFASYKPTPKISNVSYEWNSPRNRARSVDPSQTETPLFFGRTFFPPDEENDRTTLLSSGAKKFYSSSSSSPVHVEKKAKLMSTIQKLKARQKGKKPVLSLSLSGSSSYSSSISTTTSSEDCAKVSLLQENDDCSSFERQLAFDVDVLEPDDELSMKWQMIMEEPISCWEREYQPFQVHPVVPQMVEVADADDDGGNNYDADDDDTEPAYSTSLAVSDFHRQCTAYTFQRARTLQTGLSTLEEMSLDQQSASTVRTRCSSNSLRHILLDLTEI